MLLNTLLNWVGDIPEVELRMILFKSYLKRPTATLVTPRFKSLTGAEDWLTEKGYELHYYSVYENDEDDYYLTCCRIYYSYIEKQYFDQYK